MKTKNIVLFFSILMTLFLPATGAKQKTFEIQSLKIGGYVGSRIDAVIANRVMTEDTRALVNAFSTKKETNAWQTEFWGKWTVGACELYAYNHDRALYDKIKESVDGILSLQTPDGYIGNYAPDHQLEQWDIWGRKYVMLGLLSWYDVSGDKRAVKAACRQLDHLVAQLKEKGKTWVETGNYRGMPSASILDAVVKLYRTTKDKKYLAIAEDIVKNIESDKGPQLIAKAMQGVPVAKRFPVQKVWWGYENGQKAYEMMSCYQGMIDLYNVTGDKKLLDAAKIAARDIYDQEINIAGSGSASECWFGGKKLQTRPAIHEMETCVTTTWIALLRRLLVTTGDAHYADLMEQTIYNALFSSLKGDASQIAKYTPLEGVHTLGEDQCGMKINCCNANGPRGFASITKTLYTLGDDAVNVNFYIPSEAEIILGSKKNVLKIIQEGDYPKTDVMTLKINVKSPTIFSLNLRIPSWSSAATVVKVNGEPVAQNVGSDNYLKLNREWKQGDVVTVKFDMKARLLRLNGFEAIVRGPIVLARDSRLGGGDIDVVSQVAATDNVVKLSLTEGPEWAWMTFKVPAVLGVDRINHSKPADVYFCDFASAGNTWEQDQRYRVWLPEVYDASHPN